MGSITNIVETFFGIFQGFVQTGSDAADNFLETGSAAADQVTGLITGSILGTPEV